MASSSRAMVVEGRLGVAAARERIGQLSDLVMGPIGGVGR